MNRNFLITMGILMLVSSLHTQDNPFISKDVSRVDQSQSIKRIPSPKFVQRFVGTIASVQHSLNSRLSELTKAIKEEKDIGILLVLLGISMLYGIIHALGPGHGKIIMVSYAVANPLKIRNGILLGASVAFIHAISAIVFVSVIYFILKMSYFGSFGGQKRIISIVSYGAIILLGVFLIVRALIKAHRNGKNANSHTNHFKMIKNHKFFELLMVALLIGLVPCEGALFVLIFSISMEIYYIGVLLVFAIALGMAITIGTVGVIAIGLRKGITEFSLKRPKTAYIAETVFEIGGGVLVFFLGGMFFLANL